MRLYEIFRSIINSISRNPVQENIIEPRDMPKSNIDMPKSNIDNSSTYTFHIADLSEKYETSDRGPGYISNGSKWDDPGGDSYGSYKIETKQGTMKDYLTRTDDMFTRALKPLGINTPEFKKMWQELAIKYPDQFQQSQFDFLCNKPNGYNDAIAYAKKLGWAVDSFALQSAIFSTSNQSGGWKKIFSLSGIKSTDDIVTQLNKLYTARAVYFKTLTSLTPEIKESIMRQRCGKNLDLSNYSEGNERVDCLKLV